MKVYFYWSEPLKWAREISEAEFSSKVKKIEADGLDPLECLDVVHGITDDGELEIEVYLEIPSDKLKK